VNLLLAIAEDSGARVFEMPDDRLRQGLSDGYEGVPGDVAAWKGRERSRAAIAARCPILFGALLSVAGARELGAGCDIEFGEDVAQVVFDGAGADEQLCGDLRVGQSRAGELSDLGLLRGELRRGPG
jgi:hypothetical protein